MTHKTYHMPGLNNVLGTLPLPRHQKYYLNSLKHPKILMDQTLEH